ncbi:MAG: NAD(P)H-dependent oxidoreductase [Salaquimonas sp.]|nr:NAD(P)H-dependent oxidoreductase [Salaquimonas sp.]
MRFLAISGSLRLNSTNTALLDAFIRHADEGIAIELCGNVGLLPLFNPDLEADTPQAVVDFATKVDQCDGLLIASPEYAHGIPGALKNALDWLVSRFEIPDKPVMLVHASARGSFVREQLCEVLKTMSCRICLDSFECHLISKSPAEIGEILDQPPERDAIRNAVAAFAHFVEQS